MADEKYTASCKDAGLDCNFHVCDSDEDEVVNSLQDHARRVHGKDLAAEQIRPLVKTGTLACA